MISGCVHRSCQNPDVPSVQVSYVQVEGQQRVALVMARGPCWVSLTAVFAGDYIKCSKTQLGFRVQGKDSGVSAESQKTEQIGARRS